MATYDHIPQSPLAPADPRPIVSIGAGGIVRDAHYPAYQLADYTVAGLFDLDQAKSKTLGDQFGVETIYQSMSEATDHPPDQVIYDIAVPASALVDVLPQLPDRSSILMQKPMGDDLDEAKRILDICNRKQFTAAVNFQMRYAPFCIAAKHLIDSGQIGKLHSMEFRVTVHTPWSLWSFLEGIPRLEILYHSIHYVDLTRHFLGEPASVYAKTTHHPSNPKLAATRTTMILDYGDHISANIVTNHGHDFGSRHQESYIRWEGTEGAIRAKMGVLLDYPDGEPDVLEVNTGGSGWNEVPLTGTWFPHAFIGTMGSVMRVASGETDSVATDVSDAYRTMAVVEAAYQSSETGGTPIPT
jgi:predicted dehydrogenase